VVRGFIRRSDLALRYKSRGKQKLLPGFAVTDSSFFNYGLTLGGAMQRVEEVGFKPGNETRNIYEYSTETKSSPRF
jgi:hypothetical protein